MSSDGTKMKARYKSYCEECFFTIWKNEEIWFDGKPKHLNCIKSLRDDTPRTLKPSYERNVFFVTKKQMIEIVKSKRKIRKKKNNLKKMADDYIKDNGREINQS